MDAHIKVEFQNQLLALCRGAYLEGFNAKDQHNQYADKISDLLFEKTKTYKIIKGIETPEEKLAKLLITTNI